MPADAVTTLLEEARERVDAELTARLPAGDDVLARAMRHAALGPGKRVRPALIFAVADSLGLDRAEVDAPAAAVEMVHAFSLVHDDLPALDDDDLRRGRPTVHVAFDEATAILAGDGLLNLAFGVLATTPENASAEARCRAVSAVSSAVGAAGMIGGQILDLAQAASDGSGDVDDLETVHRLKTGSLMRVCGELPSIYAGVDGEPAQQVARCCESLGLMFQVRDDLLDVSHDTDALGKTAGKDRAQNKLTYPALMGIEAAQRHLEDLRDRVIGGFADLPGTTAGLLALVEFVAERQR